MAWAQRISHRRGGRALGGFAGPKERRARPVNHVNLDAVRHAAGTAGSDSSPNRRW